MDLQHLDAIDVGQCRGIDIFIVALADAVAHLVGQESTHLEAE